MESPRWNIITPSQYEWERRALDFVRAGLPDHDPYRAWANFEFQTNDGAVYEVDLLVLTKQGFFLVEIKSWPGRVSGDAGTWTRKHEGKTKSEDNPVLLTNRKSKALISLLKAQQAVKKVRVPWMDALVFLSADDLQCDLSGPALHDSAKQQGCHYVWGESLWRGDPSAAHDCEPGLTDRIAGRLPKGRPVHPSTGLAPS